MEVEEEVSYLAGRLREGRDNLQECLAGFSSELMEDRRQLLGELDNL